MQDNKEFVSNLKKKVFTIKLYSLESVSEKNRIEERNRKINKKKNKQRKR